MHLGYVFQDYALVSELNVMENVAIPAIMRGKPVSEYYATATRILEKVGLENRLDHRSTSSRAASSSGSQLPGRL